MDLKCSEGHKREKGCEIEEEGAGVVAASAALYRLDADVIWHGGRVQTPCNMAFGILAPCHTAIWSRAHCHGCPRPDR
jgi:hypothetical protein